LPNNESTKKRVRQTVRRTALNRWRKVRLKNQTKAFESSLRGDDVSEATTQFRRLCRLLDKMSHTPILHRNTAARRKARMHAMLKSMQEASAA
jgi:small subunit ribosomal protein S20